MKTKLIIKEKNTTLKLHKKYMVITTPTESTVVSYRHIEELYINKVIPLTPSELLKLAKHFKLYLIDHNGYVLGRLEVE